MSDYDGHLKIGTEIDQSGLEKGLKETDKRLQEVGKGAKSAEKASVASFAKMGVAAAAVGAAVNGAVKVVKDLTDAYVAQARAETQLDQAAKNNPYLTPASVQNLKNFASEMQAITEFGDDELFPYMGQLAAAGRTQEEIQKIIKASADIAASGTMDLGTAVKNLNMTYSGTAGRLSQYIGELKGLTEEELKSGKAIDIVSGKYAGMAEEVANVAGSGQQLKNYWGDLKEELGAPFEKAMKPVRAFFQNIIQGWTDSLAAKRKYDESKIKMAEGTATSVDIQDRLVGEREKLDALNAEFIEYYTAMQQGKGVGLFFFEDVQIRQENLERWIEDVKKRIKDQNDLMREVETSLREKLEEEAADIAQQQADAVRMEAEEAQRAAKQARADFIEQNRLAREKALEALRLEAELTGEQVDLQDELNIHMGSYIALLTESEGMVTATDKEAKELFDTTVALVEANKEKLASEEASAEALEAQKKVLDDLLSDLKDIDLDSHLKESERMQAKLARMEVQYAQLNADQKAEIEEEYQRKRLYLEQQYNDMIIAERKQNQVEVAEIYARFMSEFQSIVSSMSSVENKRIEATTKIQIAKLNEQYDAGLVSVEEYEEKKKDIERKAAEEKYKADMWEWHANVAMAMTNVALAAIKALAEGGAILGPALAAVIVAAGTAQLSNMIASKPLPPAFATGGIIGGRSYTGDKKLARVNSGEMILNRMQQRNLFDRINENNLGGEVKVQVLNQAANDVTAKPQITKDGIQLLIRRTIAEDMRKGKMDDPYRALQSNMGGQRYTS